MPDRTPLQQALIFLKGMAMGAADVVPGVSGGTIAFITGIYQELISTIHQLDLGILKVWRQSGWKAAWKSYNLGFLLLLFGGVLLSILSLARLISWLLKAHPILVWSFFFGLVVASMIYVGRDVTKWSFRLVLAIVLGTLVAYLITVSEPVGSPESNWFLFFAGFIAIIAMILPGLSGAFILLLIGAYQTVIGTLTELGAVLEGDWNTFGRSALKLLIFAAGAVLGLKIFSRALNWMFDHHKDLTLAVLIGFMAGALNKIWPWKRVLQYRTNHSGEQVPFIEQSILPSSYAGDPQLWSAIACAMVGGVLLFAIEWAGSKRKRE
jgi:putative membrane protein